MAWRPVDFRFTLQEQDWLSEQADMSGFWTEAADQLDNEARTAGWRLYWLALECQATLGGMAGGS